MYDNPEQAKLASLIISIVILIIIVVLIVVVCCNWNSINANANTNANVPIFQNPQKAALGAYAYKNNFDAKQRIGNIANAIGNIANAIKYPGGASDWANFIQAGTAKTAAVNMQNNFGKVYTNCYTTGKGQVVCTQYVDTPKNQLMGYNHQRLANIQNAKQYPGGASDWADWFQGGQARGIAQNKVYNMQNNTTRQIVNNIKNARNGGTGSDWANFFKNDQARSIAQNKVAMYKNKFQQSPREINGAPYCSNAGSYLIPTCKSLGPNSAIATWDRPPNVGCAGTPPMPGNHYSAAYTCTNAPQYGVAVGPAME